MQEGGKKNRKGLAGTLQYRKKKRSHKIMPTTITGVVTNGVIIPHSPLPEGAKVEIRLQPARLNVPPDLQEEIDDWERAGAGTVEMVETLAEEAIATERGANYG
jgi:hypothetical protein